MTTIDTTTALADDFDPEVTGPSPQALDDAPRPATSIMIALDDIVERESYTRDLQPGHVENLAASIGEVGLEQPLVLITGNLLVAGRHRLHALKALREVDAERFQRMFPGGMVPAQVFDIDEEADPQGVLSLELTENSARKNYTPAEVARASEALKAMGFASKRGRPGKDHRAMGPIIMKTFGISEATMHRALAAAKRGDKLSRESIAEAKPRGRKPKALDQDGGHAPAQVERDADQDAAAQLQALDRVAEARAAVEQMTGDELAEFAAWFWDHQSKRNNE